MCHFGLPNRFIMGTAVTIEIVMSTIRHSYCGTISISAFKDNLQNFTTSQSTGLRSENHCCEDFKTRIRNIGLGIFFCNDMSEYGGLWGYHTLVAGLLARSQYPEGPATGHLVTSFSWFPCVYKRMLRWFPILQVATACFSCSPPDLNFVAPYFVFMLSLFHIYVHA